MLTNVIDFELPVAHSIGVGNDAVLQRKDEVVNTRVALSEANCDWRTVTPFPNTTTPTQSLQAASPTTVLTNLSLSKLKS